MKNLHLQHPEDSILTGDLSVLDWFVTPGHLSLKMDGCPAIVWGTNPATKKFFVGTKSVFNKVKIKIAHSHEEIDLYYSGNVADILHECLDYLPRTKNIIQGDFIGFGGDTEYTPNTLTYKFVDVVSQRIIIAPHTVYTAEYDLRDSRAFPLTVNLNSDDDVKFVQPHAYILFDADTFDVDEICAFAKQMSTACTFVSDKELPQLKKQINDCIRQQRPIEDDAFDCDPNLIRLWKLVKSIKEDCLYLCRNTGPAAYLNNKRIDAEGYVMSNKFGMYKLVNREVFSYANFLNNNKK
ncbi:hypothetical protein PQC13_gp164 [Synechococcus phage S-SRM01]|uniref:Uncharacterized protein n=1 Tax=Synechococcus phage S-SRM01 TaxID=2781608 RepID=A0A879R2K8_9CAUD|nr:hypothetical protein PQC13_gp164 [Synechococcus phage S-SRM01]QPX48129.1 hypothetical protein [Synechococcus phage S-SRM01]